ncbi:MAG: hypothetical protein Q9208_000114 [Pyrenodesmia sp. 3 TL-2023]
MPSYSYLWYCGWCKNGPMNAQCIDHCVYCHRQRDAYATTTTQYVAPPTNISPEYVDELNTVPFYEIVAHHSIESGDGIRISPLIDIGAGKGFFQDKAGVWTIYRRNDFSIACTLRLGRTQSLPYYTKTRIDGPQAKVSRFHLALSAQSGSGNPVSLQSHTPGRGKAALPSTEELLTFSTAIDPSSPSNQWNAEFGRMQFKSATVNNGKSRAAQQHFHLIITLLAETRSGGGSHTVIASRTSFPLIVRGRSLRKYGNNDTRARSTHESRVIESAEGSTERPSTPIDQVLEPRPTKEDTSSNSTANQDNTGWPALADSALVEDDTESDSKLGQELQAGVEPANHATERVEVGLPRTDMSEDSSISSVGRSSRSVVSSKSSVAVQQNSLHQLVDLFLGDSGFRALCEDGFRCLQSDPFEKYLLRLYKIFFKSIREIRSAPLNRVFMQHRGRARNLVTTMRSKLAAEADSKNHPLKNIATKQVDKKQSLEKFLSDTQVEYASDAQALDDARKRKMQLETEFASSSSDQQSDGQAEVEPITLSQSVSEIILGSDAWEDLREGLMGFVVPILVANHHERYHQNVVAEASQHETAQEGIPPATDQVQRADTEFSGTPGPIHPLLTIVRDAQAACKALIVERTLNGPSDVMSD